MAWLWFLPLVMDYTARNGKNKARFGTLVMGSMVWLLLSQCSLKLASEGTRGLGMALKLHLALLSILQLSACLVACSRVTCFSLCHRVVFLVGCSNIFGLLHGTDGESYCCKSSVLISRDPHFSSGVQIHGGCHLP
ncbi:hypothetical protein RJT34_12961 [Clitoria ternatea]|uniref:Uncharacterized protein n=1 Tax=Clitoria ternatea TaxID=43366 RepID=A0AAN9JN21_CLITE